TVHHLDRHQLDAASRYSTPSRPERTDEFMLVKTVAGLAPPDDCMLAKRGVLPRRGNSHTVLLGFFVKLMRRRVFIGFLGSVVAAWPRVARSQQSAGMRHIGVLIGNASSADDQLGQQELQPFQDALRQAGWIDGKTIKIDFRYGAGDPAKIETAAAELVRLAPDVIYAITLKAVQAVSQKTLTIPIVFSLVAEPINMEMVTSVSHPGGNVTGFAVLDPAASGKWLQLLKEIAPSVSRVGVLYNPDVAPYAAAFVSAGTNAAGQSLKLLERPVRNDADIEAAATSIGDEPNGAL